MNVLLSFSKKELALPFDESAGFTAPPAFGSYRVLHQIGSGVLGPVFRTFDPQRDRLVAVKAFRLEILPEQVARLADALRRLATAVPEHPGIVRPLEAGLEGTTAYLASEYVAAETLDVALRHLAPAPLARALPILAKLADAIDAAWEAGTGHGALHPRDVFVSVERSIGSEPPGAKPPEIVFDVRLTGVGVASALESIGVKGPVRRPYAAPERVNGEPWDLRADVYSLGAIAHELLTRRRPAGSGEQDGALTTDTSAEQRVQIRRVLSAVLAERPQHRFQSARAFTDALEAVSRGEAVAAIPEIELEDDEVAPQDETQALPFVEVEAPFESPDLQVQGETVVPPAPPAAVSPPGPTGFYAPRAIESPPRAVLPEPIAPVGVPATPPEFPWSALAAAGAAMLVVGVVIGYQWAKWSMVAPAAVSTAAPASAAETEVRMPSEPVPAASLLGQSDANERERVSPRERSGDSGVPASERARGSAGAKPPGRLIVRSVPPGAMVVVDGRPRGQTPANLSEFAFGDHTVDVARSGFVPYSERVTLTAGAPSRTVSVRLQAGIPTGTADPRAPAAAMGSLFIDSRPQGGRVIIDGRFAGVTPLRVSDVRAGAHEVRIERPGFQGFMSNVDVKSGEQARVTAALEERRN